MPNPIKYNVSPESLALKKGNFWIGTGDVDKGPTSSTGYYYGITPPVGGYTIYQNKASDGPSIRVATNDSQLISETNYIAKTSYTTKEECFNYFAGQSDKMVVNRDYESIVTNGLVLNVDAGFLPSYIRTGVTINDISGNDYGGTFTNGASFTTENGGGVVFDGSNDYVLGNNSLSSKVTDAVTIIVFAKVPNMNNRVPLFSKYQTVPPYGYILEVGTHPGPLWSKSMRFFASGDNDNTRSTDYRGTISLSDDTVYMYTAQYSNTQAIMKMYYNTTEMTANQVNPNWTNVLNWGAGTNPYYLGAYQPPIGVYGNCTIYNTLVYNRILSYSEITQNFDALKGRYGL